MRFGVGFEKHTLREVGDKMGVTRERIRQIEKKALAKLSKKTDKKIDKITSEMLWWTCNRQIKMNSLKE